LIVRTAALEILNVEGGENGHNHERTHQGKMCCGQTPMETCVVGKKIWQEKLIG
jgi:hypothetical protein